MPKSPISISAPIFSVAHYSSKKIAVVKNVQIYGVENAFASQ